MIQDRSEKKSCPRQLPERQDGPLVPPRGPKVESQKEYLKAVLIRSKTSAVQWKKLVSEYFLAKATESGEGKVTLEWSLPVTAGDTPAKEDIMQAAKELAHKAAQAEEVANKLNRLAARVSLAKEKADLLAAMARFFPRLQKGTQQALNACKNHWQNWDLHSLKQLFFLTRVFYEAYEKI